MSSVYHTEPPTNGKVILHTSYGPIDVELWSKEAPLACRNFVQLALEGYYDRTTFHRVIKGFMVQGGDPTGTGEGGEAVGEPFKDEVNGRLRFNHRGQLAMANESRPNTNRSQFFLTLDECRWLDGKHTIFGTVAGQTIFNLLRIGETELENDRPVEDVVLKNVEVLLNPFDDIVPRDLSPPEQPKPKRKTVVKDARLLSFADEQDEPVTRRQSKPAPKQLLSANEFSDRMQAQLRERRERIKRRANEPPKRDDDDEEVEQDQAKLAKLAELRRQAELKKEALRKPAVPLVTDEDNRDAGLLTPFEAVRQSTKRKKANACDREADTLARLSKFKQSMHATKQHSTTTTTIPEEVEAYSGQILDEDDGDDDDPNWFVGKLKFRKHTDDLFSANSGADGRPVDDYLTIDDRRDARRKG